MEGVVCECSEDTGEDKQERKVGVGMRSIDEDWSGVEWNGNIVSWNTTCLVT